VWSVAWSPDGRHLASATDDGTVQVWDASTGNTLLTYRGHTDSVKSVAWSSDGTRLASGSVDQTVQVWDAATGSTLHTYRKPLSLVQAVAWSPDGKRLAAGADDRTVQVWDAATGSTLLIYQPHSAAVNGLAWSPDSTRLASASDDSTVQIWNVSTGTALLAYQQHDSAVNSVAWSPDGARLASTGHDATVRVWQAPPSIQATTSPLVGNYATTITPDDIPKDYPELSGNVGAWIITFANDGSYAVFSHGQQLTEAMYKVTQNQLTITDNTRCIQLYGPNAATGTYTWMLEGKMLTLKAVQDICLDQKLVLSTHPWVKQG
jgi:WD40 repeat protein